MILIQNVIKTALENRSDFFKAKALLLDQMFLRDTDDRLEIVEAYCPNKFDVATRLGGIPIPNLSKGEPSDHLAISISLAFKKQSKGLGWRYS
jgi:hypothetical protein